MSEPKGTSGIRYGAMTRVHVRGIDALHDLRWVPSFDRFPRTTGLDLLVALQQSGQHERLVFKSFEEARWSDLRGQWVEGGGDLLDGVYRGVRYSDGREVLQTFRRDRTETICDRWLYVFSGQRPDGTDARLHKEVLLARDGYHEALPPGGDSARRPLQRRDGEWLDLPRQRWLGTAWEECFYFFHLAPAQLTWEAIQELGKAIGVRGARLGDPFFTDVLEKGRPVMLPEASVDGAPLVLYLVDALAEAHRRRVVYEEVLRARDEWKPDLEGCYAPGQDPYPLAKELQSFAASNAAFWSLVDEGLTQFFRTTERRLRQLQWVLNLVAQDHVAWLGRESRPCAIGGGRVSQLLVRGARRWGVPAPARERDVALVNHFSAMAGDYADAADETRSQVGCAVAATQLSLSESEVGRAFLRANFGSVLGTERRAADGGLRMILNPKKPTYKVPGAALGLVIAAYSDCWALEFRQDTVRQFNEWLSRRFSGKTAQHLVNKEWRVQWGLYRAAGKTPLKSIAADPDWVKAVSDLKDATRILEAAVKLVGLADAVRSLGDDPALRKDGWAWADVTGKAIDCGQSIVKAFGQGKVLEIPLCDKVTVLDKATRSLGVVERLKGVNPWSLASTIISLSVKGARLGQIYDRGELEGEVIAMTGSALAGLAGVLTGSTLGIGIPLALGLAIQYGAEYSKAHRSAPQRFLRWTQFGERNGWEQYVNRNPNLAESWYHGPPDPARPGEPTPRPASDLTKDVALQRRTLMEVNYDFTPRLVPLGAVMELRVRTRNVAALNPASRWTILHSIYTSAGPSSTERLQPTLGRDPDDETVLVTAVKSFPKVTSIHVPGPYGSIVTVQLDVWGDGSTVIERTVREW